MKLDSGDSGTVLFPSSLVAERAVNEASETKGSIGSIL